MKITPFHLAIQVRDLVEAREFYGSKLGFPEGRSSDCWIDFDMFGHQLVTHLNPKMSDRSADDSCNQVDGHGVPVPHFGVVLDFENWSQFMKKIEPLIDNFLIPPYIRFEGLPGEQGTAFFKDPSGNAIEFKGFTDISTQLFEKD